MRTLLCLGLAFGLIAVATALTCKSCSFRVLSICITSSSSVPCTGNCSYTKVSLGSLSLFNKQQCTQNCTSTTTTQTDSVFNFDYNINCCGTDNCNSGGNSIKISLSLGLGMALLWLLNAM